MGQGRLRGRMPKQHVGVARPISRIPDKQMIWSLLIFFRYFFGSNKLYLLRKCLNYDLFIVETASVYVA